MQLICKNFSPWKRPLYSMALAIDFMDGHGLSNKESWAPAKEDKRWHCDSDSFHTMCYSNLEDSTKVGWFIYKGKFK